MTTVNRLERASMGRVVIDAESKMFCDYFALDPALQWGRVVIDAESCAAESR